MMRVAVCLCLWAVEAAAWCIKPVENGSPIGFEVTQPYRMVGEIVEVPGYPYLVIAPTNRGSLYTIRNGRFEELGADFPVRRSWSYRDWYLLEDGRVWGIANEGFERKLYVLQPGEDEFVPEGPTGFIGHILDPFRQSILLNYENQGLMEWEGTNLSAAPFGRVEFDRNSILPTYIAELGVYISRVDETFYAIDPTRPADWHKIDYGWRRPPNSYTSLVANDFGVSGDGQLVAFDRGTALDVFRRTDRVSFERVYSLRGGHDVIQAEDGRLWAIERSELQRSYVLEDRRATEMPGGAVPRDVGPRLTPKSRQGTQTEVPSVLFDGTFENDRDSGISIRLSNGTGEQVLSAPAPGTYVYVGDVPMTDTGLILLEDGLHLLKQDCANAIGDWQQLETAN